MLKTTPEISSEVEENFSFLIPNTKITFTRLRQALIKAPILYYIYSKCDIRIETDTLGYAIGCIFSQLNPGSE